MMPDTYFVVTFLFSKVKDSKFGNTFDLSELYNSDKDYNVNLGSGVNYGINICGSKNKS